MSSCFDLFSFGSLLSFEVARKLKSRYNLEPYKMFISGTSPAHVSISQHCNVFSCTAVFKNRGKMLHFCCSSQLGIPKITFFYGPAKFLWPINWLFGHEIYSKLYLPAGLLSENLQGPKPKFIYWSWATGPLLSFKLEKWSVFFI